MDPDSLNDQDLVDYANRSKENMDRVQMIAQRKLELYPNPYNLTEHGELYALRLYFEQGGSMDNLESLIRVASMSGQEATSKYLKSLRSYKPLGLDSIPGSILATMLKDDPTTFGHLSRVNPVLNRTLKGYSDLMQESHKMYTLREMEERYNTSDMAIILKRAFKDGHIIGFKFRYGSNINIIDPDKKLFREFTPESFRKKFYKKYFLHSDDYDTIRLWDTFPLKNGDMWYFNDDPYIMSLIPK